jgi:hypothetical protein
MQQKASENRQQPDKPEQPSKRPYEAPQILSEEPLEAVAATCLPATGGFGKSGPLCIRHGS